MRTLYFLLAWFILIVFLSVRDAIEAAQPAPIGIAVALIIPIGLYFIDRPGPAPATAVSAPLFLGMDFTI